MGIISFFKFLPFHFKLFSNNGTKFGAPSNRTPLLTYKYMNKNSALRIDKTIRDEVATYVISLDQSPTLIMYREFIIPKKIKGIKRKEKYEKYVFIETKDLNGITFEQIYDFIKNILKNKKSKNRVGKLNKFLKSNNVSCISGKWTQDDFIKSDKYIF